MDDKVACHTIQEMVPCSFSSLHEAVAWRREFEAIPEMGRWEVSIGRMDMRTSSIWPQSLYRTIPGVCLGIPGDGEDIRGV